MAPPVAGTVAPPVAGGAAPAPAGTFDDDVNFLQMYEPSLVVLSDPLMKARVAVSPAWQGRVMTSTAGDARGLSFGWINRELIASRQIKEHINVFGGEDRFWMGPEGGQYSIFFAPGTKFDLATWFTPAPLDTEPFEVVQILPDRVSFRRQFQLLNKSGTRFDVLVDREVRLLSEQEAWTNLKLPPTPGVELVAYESVNRITNAGQQRWRKNTGLLSIWILGMYQPSPQTTIVLPFRKGPQAMLGPIVNDAYFGKVPPDRLKIRNGVIFFRGDGQQRGKIGLSPQRARRVMGSYDAASGALTLVQFTLPRGRTDYVNSLWKRQKFPYKGDASNSYNDGPPMPGVPPLGPFYELESSSPAAALAPGASMSHTHRTFHLVGDPNGLNQIATALLTVDLATIQGTFD